MTSFPGIGSLAKWRGGINGAWLLVLASAATAATACGSEAEDCATTQTCIEPGDDGGGGEAGDDGQGGSAGSPTGGKGGNGGNGGTSGSAGASGRGGSAGRGGTSGAAGSGGADDEPPTVEAFTPDDGTSDVERDIEVTAELSEPIDEATVTETSVTLTGPDGEVAGTLSVDENVISFVPDVVLDVLGTYTFTLADTIADLAGNTLEASASAEFQVRDGAWGQPTFPFGSTGTPRIAIDFQRNALGDVVIGTEILPAQNNVIAGVYHAAEDRWSIEDVPDANTVHSVAIDSNARAVIAWGGSQFGWSRTTTTESWEGMGTFSSFNNLTVTPGGQVLGVTYDVNINAYASVTQSLAGGSNGPVQELPVAPTVMQLVSSLERLGIVVAHGATEGFDISFAWKTSTSWGTPEPLTHTDDLENFSCDSDEEGNIIVVWLDNGEVWSRVYERAQDEWTQPLLVLTTGPNASLSRPDITTGRAVVAVSNPTPAQSLAAVYEPGVGWIANSVLVLQEVATGVPAVSIDRHGNALAVWSSLLRYRRYVAGVGWSTSSSLEQSIDTGHLWLAASPDGSMLLATNNVAGMTVGPPAIYRFE